MLYELFQASQELGRGGGGGGGGSSTVNKVNSFPDSKKLFQMDHLLLCQNRLKRLKDTM